VVESWTLPQAVYMWVVGRDIVASEARRGFVLQISAIAAVFGKNGKQIAQGVLRALEGPRLTVEDMMQELDPISQMVLFGKRSEDDGNQANSD